MGDEYVIRVEGELHLIELAHFERALGDAEESDAARVLLDLDEMTFIDAGGLRALRDACRRSKGNGNRLRVTRGRGIVADMFRLTALDITLPFAVRDPYRRVAASYRAHA